MSGKFTPAGHGEPFSRDWFHRLVNARENPATMDESQEWIIQRLAATVVTREPPLLKEGGVGVAMTTANSIPNAKVSLPSPEPTQADLIAFHAPVALLEGAWLQSVALAGSGYGEPVNRLFAAYLALLGVEASDSPAFAYRGWLNLCQVSLPQTSAWRFAHDTRIGAPALNFSCLQLALGIHSASFIPETLGFTLAYLQSESPWRLPALPTPKRNAVLANMANHLERALRQFPSEDPQWPRVCKGFALYQTQEEDYLSSLQGFAHKPASLAEHVAEIFRAKRRFAIGYHAAVKLGGLGLEDCFAESTFDAKTFLDAFASSIYAKGEKDQRLFNQLNQFGGPMFGVFDPAELEKINAWLDQEALSRDQNVSESKLTPTVVQKGFAAGLRPKAYSRHDTLTHLSPAAIDQHPPGGLHFANRTDNRNLFHLLTQPSVATQTLAAAQLRVERSLFRTRQTWHCKTPPQHRFFNYTPQNLAQRIGQIHAAEIAKYQPLQAPPKLGREEYAWGIRQLAPAVLVDGCWLQHTGEAVGQDWRTQRLLFQIYAEELGAGNVDWNHPKIYRDLLNDLGIKLPSVENLAFAADKHFLDSAFDLPSYLLAISQFPKTYFPEILGLNLAIELSGLGGGYLRLAEELRYWDINPLIVTLHLSIDNLAGGHAAMACEAMQLYLDEILALGGTALQEEMWRRVWNGYLSLQSVTRRFKWALILGFCTHFLPKRTGQFFHGA